MVVSVRLFAILAEQAGSRSIDLELPEGATVADALAAAGDRPELSDPLQRLKVVMAVNREYAPETAVLKEGDELALIPPVSGGATAARPEPQTEWGRRFWAAVEGTEAPPPSAELLGWRPIELEPGRTVIEFEARDEFVNPAGLIQGGFLAAMLDDTMGPGAVAAHGGDAFTPTLELKVSFLRPASPGKLIGEGRVVHMGRSIVFLAGRLLDDQGNVVATATATSQLLRFDAEREPEQRPLPNPPPAPEHEGPPAQSFMDLVAVKAGGVVPRYAHLLGEWPLEAEPGRATMEFYAGRELLNPNGVVQGGFLTAMLDETMGPAGMTVLDPGLIVPTIELKTSYLRPAAPGLLTCQADVVSRGGSVVFTEATLSNEVGEAVATATGSARVFPLEKLLNR